MNANLNLTSPSAQNAPMMLNDRLLSRREAAEYLTSLGYRIAPATLAKLACVGGSPLFTSFGRKPLYRAIDLLDWAQSKSTAPRRSTSDAGNA